MPKTSSKSVSERTTSAVVLTTPGPSSKSPSGSLANSTPRATPSARSSDAIAEKLRGARSIVLSTHRQCDGDGLGAQLALMHGLRKLGKEARVINVDAPSAKYAFLQTESFVEVFAPGRVSVPDADLSIILDTNDGRLLEPLYAELQKKCRQTLFIDHHPVLKEGPYPTPESLIDVSAASTGELCYRILMKLGVELDAQISRALYTSLAFDTHLFRFVKSDPSSHEIAADLLRFERSPEDVHRSLFATYTVEKMRFLTAALGQVEYAREDRLAFIPIRATLSESLGITAEKLDRDDSGDVIDQVMNIGSIEVSALLREDAPGRFKLSLRSKGTHEVLSLAETFGGGGHRYASGAYLEGEFDVWREKILKGLHDLLSGTPAGSPSGSLARSSSGSAGDEGGAR